MEIGEGDRWAEERDTQLTSGKERNETKKRMAVICIKFIAL